MVLFYAQQNRTNKTERKSLETNFNNITKVIKCAAAAFGVSTINLTRGLETNKTFTVLCFSVFCWRHIPFMYSFYKPARTFFYFCFPEIKLLPSSRWYESNKILYEKGSIHLWNIQRETSPSYNFRRSILFF